MVTVTKRHLCQQISSPTLQPVNTAASHRSRLICRFARHLTKCLFKDCEHAKPQVHLLTTVTFYLPPFLLIRDFGKQYFIQHLVVYVTIFYRKLGCLRYNIL